MSAPRHPRTAASARAAKTPAKLPPGLRRLKVAIVCDWLIGTGGAERVVLELHRMFPKAPIYTSQYDRNPKIWYGGDWFKDADVRTLWLQQLPKRLRKFLPLLRTAAFSRLDLSDYDLVLISSGAEAKSVKTGPSTTSVWYCHAPTHYYWSRYDQYMASPGFGSLDNLARFGLRSLVGPLRAWDKVAAGKPDFIIANSTHTKHEIKKYYGRSARVVFPPVDIDRFTQVTPPKQPMPPPSQAGSFAAARERFGFVTAGRQTPYKRLDLAVEACSRLRLPLTVIGNGPDHSRLTAMAGPTVRFLTNVSDAEMAHHFNLAQAFIFPGVDDFGIVAVEAMSAGTPVIAYQEGGALDYVKPGVSGEFFGQPTAESLMDTLRHFDAAAYDSKKVRKIAAKFSVAQFQHRMAVTLDTLCSQKPSSSPAKIAKKSAK